MHHQPRLADWVARRTGLTFAVRAGPGADSVGLALRLNPRRSHLLVSAVLGKYIPAAPDLIEGAAKDLANLVARRLAVGPAASVVIGYAETATALGHIVADVLRAPYVHSTRRTISGVAPAAVFCEPHSHAPSHHLLPTDAEIFKRSGPVVLVDDELSTGTTVGNTIEALHGLFPHQHYLVATLTDVRPRTDQAVLTGRLEKLGARIEVVSLLRGRIALSDTTAQRCAELIKRSFRNTESTVGRDGPPEYRKKLRRMAASWPSELPEGGRHGFSPEDRSRLGAAVHALAGRVARRVLGERLLVLGCEEFMYVPLRLALELQRCLGSNGNVLFASTGRSPALAVDQPGYPIRSRMAFPAPGFDDTGWRFAYNLTVSGVNQPFDDVICVIEHTSETRELYALGGMLDAVATACRQLLLVVVPDHRPFSGPPVPTRGSR
ncbi:MAG: phosphoribosyltransferase family protein [Pseudonocardia sp.]|nr:phosphoribosyltransferase family protein [Pseudonocardia sp.]